MSIKKTLTGMVLALSLVVPAASQQKQPEFSLIKPKQECVLRLDINSRPEINSYIKMQGTFRRMGEQYYLTFCGNGFRPEMNYASQPEHKPQELPKLRLSPLPKNNSYKPTNRIVIFEKE